jgi:L-alanine-DL-glutamate epimerase-like enolase superfamily enzyme
MKITEMKIHQPMGLLRLITDQGLEGWCLGVDANSAQLIQGTCRQALVGQEVHDRERLWQELVRLDRFAYLPHAVRGYVDVALWDLAGKAVGLPVFRLIGGFRQRLPVYKSGPNLPAVDDFVRDAVQAREEGFFGYKDHCYHGAAGMIKVARATRQAVGPDFHLMHDCVQNYHYIDALKVGRVLEECEYTWFEEPLRDFDLLGLKKLSAELEVPVAATEYLPGSAFSTSQLVAQQAVDIVRASIPWRGGITDLLKIARLAEAFGLNCEVTSVGVGHGFVHAHVLGAIRNCRFFEGWKLGSLGGEPLIQNPLQIAQGYVEVPTGPGLGMELDWEAVEKHTEQVI